MDNTKTYVASVAMHSAMGDPTTNLDRIAVEQGAFVPGHREHLLRAAPKMGETVNHVPGPNPTLP